MAAIEAAATGRLPWPFQIDAFIIFGFRPLRLRCPPQRRVASQPVSPDSQPLSILPAPFSHTRPDCAVLCRKRQLSLLLRHSQIAFRCRAPLSSAFAFGQP